MYNVCRTVGIRPTVGMLLLDYKFHVKYLQPKFVFNEIQVHVLLTSCSDNIMRERERERE